MESKGSYVIVGLFVLLLGVTIVASLFWLGGWSRRADATYLVYMEESVSGLTEGAPVKFRGVDVGRVDELGLSPESPEVVQLTLSLAPDTPVLEDTRAELEFQGLTGLAFINLVGGTRGAEPLLATEGQEYPIIQSGPSIFVRFDNGISDLLVSVTETSDRVGVLLERVDQDRLARIVENLDVLTTVMAEHSGEIGGAVGSAERFFESATATTDPLPAVLDEMDALAKDLRATTGTLGEVAAAGGDDLRRVSGEVSGSVRLLTSDLRQLVERLERVTADLEEDPTMFIYGRPHGPKGPGE